MKQRAILVDWELYRHNPHTQKFISDRADQARMILLVQAPELHDYEYTDDNDPWFVEWDAVIRNTGGLDVVKFKQKALEIIQDVSNLDPVIALDKNSRVNSMYRAHGVLITIEDM